MKRLRAALQWIARHKIRTVACLALALSVASFVTPPTGWNRALRVRRANLRTLRHAIFIRGDGRAADLVDERGQLIDVANLFGQAPPRSARALRQEVKQLQDSARTAADSLVQPHPNYDYDAYLHGLMTSLERSGKTHVLLWIHGGRNPLVSSPTRTLALAESLASTEFYPICINWQSSDLSSYWAHLTYARPAKRNLVERVYVALKAPLLFALDWGRGIIRTPLAAYYDVARTWTALHADRRRVHGEVDGLWYGRGAAQDGARRWASALWAVVTLPVRSLFLIALNALAPGEWESLRHSTQQMFQTDEDMRRSDLPLPHRRDTGALSQFTDSLADRLRPGMKVTIVGHSMGTMIACELLRHERWPIGNLVFMAAACGTHDLLDTVLPTLQANPEARFYNLTLHQANDIDETVAPVIGDLFYRGSLLTWIDDFLGTTETPMERTLGRDENAVATSRLVPDELRSRVIFKAFGRQDAKEESLYGRDGVPQKHGDFSDPRLRFWRDAFWAPGGSLPGQLGRIAGDSARVVSRMEGRTLRRQRTARDRRYVKERETEAARGKP